MVDTAHNTKYINFIFVTINNVEDFEEKNTFGKKTYNLR